MPIRLPYAQLEGTTAPTSNHEADDAPGSDSASDSSSNPLPKIPMGGTPGRRGSVPGWVYIVILLVVLGVGIAWELLR